MSHYHIHKISYQYSYQYPAGLHRLDCGLHYINNNKTEQYSQDWWTAQSRRHTHSDSKSIVMFSTHTHTHTPRQVCSSVLFLWDIYTGFHKCHWLNVKLSEWERTNQISITVMPAVREKQIKALRIHTSLSLSLCVSVCAVRPILSLIKYLRDSEPLSGPHSKVLIIFYLRGKVFSTST